MEKVGHNSWFQKDSDELGGSKGNRKMFNTYRDKFGPLIYRKKKDIGEQETEEGNAFSGALSKAKKLGKDTFTVDGKTYPVKGESKEQRDEFDGRKSKVIGVYSNIDKQRMEEGEIGEKWKGNVDVKKTGQYANMTIDQLDSEIKKLKDRTQKMKDSDKKVSHKDRTKMSQLYFAKRAKKDWPGKGKTKVSESFKLTESEIIDLIERIVMEQTNIGKKTSSVEPEFNKIEKKNKEVNDKHIKDTVKKMKEYLKDASEGDYDMEPKKFPQGNGEMKETPKKAYKASDAVEEYIENLAFPGMTNLVYDEIKPNDEWIEANIKGSSKTGNAQTDEDGNALGNVVPSELGEKMYKNYKDNVYGAEQMNASYKRYPQPVDQAGESTEEGDLALKKGAKKSQEIFQKLGESKENKQEKLISEEIQKMKSLVDYNKKTQ